MKYFVVLLFILSTLYGDSYYDKGVLVSLSQKKLISPKRLSYVKNNQPVLVTNKLIVKSSMHPFEYFEKKYNITLTKHYKNVYIYTVENILNLLPLCRKIYEEDDVVYAQPVFVKTIQHHNIAFRNNLINKPMHTRVKAQAFEDTKSMLDDEESVNYYKYYDDVFRYYEDSFWHLYNSGGWTTTAGFEGETYEVKSVKDVDTNVLEVLDANITGKGVKILVVDSSFELNHPDLRFSNTYNFNLQNKDITPDSTADFHGTAVAGVIGANRGNNYGIMGVAPDSYMIAFNGLFDIEDDTAFTESYIDIFYKALELDVDIINCSWTSTSMLDEASIDAINTFVKEARDGKGGFVVFSSGNESSTSLLNEPSLKNVISVGSIEADGSKSLYSNYGEKLDLVAPSNFVSIDMLGDNGFSASEMGFVAGSSFSAPIVSGIIALMLEVNPTITLDSALDAIYSTTKKVGDYNYNYDIDSDNRFNILYTKSLETGYGLIDAKAIIDKIILNKASTDANSTDQSESSIVDNLKSGWNFVGTSEDIDDFSIFDSVAIIWVYENEAWYGYSSNTLYAKELREQNKLLTHIAKNSGIWIYKHED